MELSILQPNLAAALKTVLPAVAARPTLPVLGHVLLEADEGSLCLSCTDLEWRIDASVPADIQEGGAFTVPARLFADLVAALPAERVDLSLDDNALHLTCGKSKADVRGIDADEFPQLRTIHDIVTSFSFYGKDLARIARLVAFAAAADESRPILTGVHVVAQGDGRPYTFAAADGFRLAVCEHGTSSGEPCKVTIPAHTFAQAGKLAGGNPGQLTHIDVGQTFARFTIRDVTVGDVTLRDVVLTTQVIEGHYVNYQQIIPETHTTQAIVNRAALARALNSASVIGRQEDAGNCAHFGIKPTFDELAGHVRINIASTETGEFEAVVSADVTGDGLDIAFDLKLVLDVLNAVGDEQVAIQATVATRPATFKPVGSDAYTHVIMPMHLREL